MSSSGIQSISSGPLIIRTYNDSTSSDVTYLLKDYDYPVSSNYVLITSTNGQLVPSDNIYISSITISSINGLPYTPGSGGSVSSISSGTNISITGTSSNPIINVDINSTLLMNGFPIYDNNTITIAAGSIINLSTLSTSIVLDQASQSVTITSVPTTTIRGFTGTDDGILRVNGYVALYGSTTQLQINDTNGSIKGSLSYSYTDDDIHLNAIQLLDLSGNQGLALTSQNGQRIRFNTNGGGNLDADIEGSITLTAGYSTSTGNINLNTASTSIVLDQASQSIILTANNGININASTLFNGSIKVASTFYDNSNLSGTAGHVLTAGTGGQVIWSTISGGGGSDVFWASTLNGDIVNTNTGIVNISTALIVNNSFSTLTIFDNIGLPGTTGQVLTAGPGLGAQVIWSNTLNLLSISTTSISTTSISTSTINGLPYPPQDDTFWASTLSNGGITNTNTGIVYISTSLIVRPPAGEALIEIVARDGANAAALHWEQSTIGVALDMNLQANGVTIMAPYGSAGNNLITIGDPRASVGPPALLANSEIFGFTSGYQAGIATIANGTNSVSVINTNMTATSIIMFTFAYFVDATLTSVCARPFAGVGFDIEGNANATSGPVYVFYFIVRY